MRHPTSHARSCRSQDAALPLRDLPRRAPVIRSGCRSARMASGGAPLGLDRASLDTSKLRRCGVAQKPTATPRQRDAPAEGEGHGIIPPTPGPVSVCSVSKGTAHGAALKRDISATAARAHSSGIEHDSQGLGTLKTAIDTLSIRGNSKCPSMHLPLDQTHQGGPTSSTSSAQHDNETSSACRPLTSE